MYTGSLILLYITDIRYTDDVFPSRKLNESLVSYNNRIYPICHIGVSSSYKKYPCMCIVNRKGSRTDLLNFVSERRGLFKKWQNGERDPQDYMYVYKYEVLNQENNNLKVNAKVLFHYLNESDLLVYLDYLERTYLVYYDGCFVPENRKNLIDLKSELTSRILKPSVNDSSPNLSPIDTRSSRERYRDSHREVIKDRNHLYYLSKKTSPS